MTYWLTTIGDVPPWLTSGITMTVPLGFNFSTQRSQSQTAENVMKEKSRMRSSDCMNGDWWLSSARGEVVGTRSGDRINGRGP